MEVIQNHKFETSLVSAVSPIPRTSWLGMLARFLGPGATQAELWLQLLPAVIAAIAAPVYALNLSHSWTKLQIGFIALLGFHCVGGILTNATATAKRCYHRSGQGWQQDLVFVGLHGFQIVLVA